MKAAPQALIFSCSRCRLEKLLRPEDKLVMVLRTVSSKLLAMTANARITKTASPLDILERAEKLLGRDKIAEGLRVSKNIVESWCDGTGTLSNSHLLRLADLLAKYADANR